MTLDAEHAPDAPDPSDRDEPRRSPQPPEGPDHDHDADVAEIPDPTRPTKRRGGAGAGVLGAAMLAVGEIFEPEKTSVEIVQTDDEPLDDLPFGIDFGDLPPLG